MSKLTVTVPDIGGAENVEIIEINVAVGDSVNADQDLLVLETDKATMEIPCPQAGKVLALLVKVGDKVSEGSAILELESADSADTEQNKAEPATAAQAPAQAAPVAEINAGAADASATDSSAADSVESLIDLVVPDLGGASEVTVIELCVQPGDNLNADDSLIVLETDKASMDIPAPVSGTLKELLINIGDKVKEGQVYGRLLTQAQQGSAATAQQTSAQQTAAQPALNNAVENAPAPTAAAVSAVPVAAAPVVSETTNSAEKTDIHNVSAFPSSGAATGCRFNQSKRHG